MIDWNKKNFFGTSLSDKDLKGGKVITVSWNPRLEYIWDAGIAIGKYLRGLKDGKLIGARCNRCRKTMIPPRAFCEWCFRAVDSYIELKDTGTVQTFSICYVTWDAKRIKEPQIPAVIEIDGASRGMGIMHLLGDIDPKDVKIGMRVKAVWKRSEERLGAITDIMYFKPIR